MLMTLSKAVSGIALKFSALQWGHVVAVIYGLHSPQQIIYLQHSARCAGVTRIVSWQMIHLKASLRGPIKREDLIDSMKFADSIADSRIVDAAWAVNSSFIPCKSSDILPEYKMDD